MTDEVVADPPQGGSAAYGVDAGVTGGIPGPPGVDPNGSDQNRDPVPETDLSSAPNGQAPVVDARGQTPAVDANGQAPDADANGQTPAVDINGQAPVVDTNVVPDLSVPPPGSIPVPSASAYSAMYPMQPGMVAGVPPMPGLPPASMPGIPPIQPMPGMAPGMTPAMALGMTPAMAPGMTPGMAPGMTPGMDAYYYANLYAYYNPYNAYEAFGGYDPYNPYMGYNPTAALSAPEIGIPGSVAGPGGTGMADPNGPNSMVAPGMGGPVGGPGILGGIGPNGEPSNGMDEMPPPPPPCDREERLQPKELTASEQRIAKMLQGFNEPPPGGQPPAKKKKNKGGNSNANVNSAQHQVAAMSFEVNNGTMSNGTISSGTSNEGLSATNFDISSMNAIKAGTGAQNGMNGISNSGMDGSSSSVNRLSGGMRNQNQRQNDAYDEWPPLGAAFTKFQNKTHSPGTDSTTSGSGSGATSAKTSPGLIDLSSAIPDGYYDDNGNWQNRRNPNGFQNRYQIVDGDNDEVERYQNAKVTRLSDQPIQLQPAILQELRLALENPGGHDLNITDRAVQNWSALVATDEFVQNWHDQTGLNPELKGKIVDGTQKLVVLHEAPMNHMTNIPQHMNLNSGAYGGYGQSGQQTQQGYNNSYNNGNGQQNGHNNGWGGGNGNDWKWRSNDWNQSGNGNDWSQGYGQQGMNQQHQGYGNQQGQYGGQQGPGLTSTDNMQDEYRNSNYPFKAIYVAQSRANPKVWLKLSYISWDPETKTLELVNNQSCLPPRAFAAGHTGEEKMKENSRKAKGKFGDGLQSACSVFARPNAEVQITTCGFEYSFSYKPKKVCPKIYTLHYVLRQLEERKLTKQNVYDESNRAQSVAQTAQQTQTNRGQTSAQNAQKTAHTSDVMLAFEFDSSKDTRVILRGAAFDRLRYLFLTPGYNCFNLIMKSWKSQQQTEILRGPYFRNKLYVKGMLVQENSVTESESKHFGYNLLNFEMKSRDRQNSLTYLEEKQQIIQAWYEALVQAKDDSSEGTHKMIASYLFKAILHKPDCAEARALQADYNDSGCRVKKKLWEWFCMNYPGSGVSNPKLDNKLAITNGQNDRQTRQTGPGQPFARGNEQRKKQILKCGYLPVEVPHNLFNMLSPYTPCLDTVWQERKITAMKNAPDASTSRYDSIKTVANLYKSVVRVLKDDLTNRVRTARYNWVLANQQYDPEGLLEYFNGNHRDVQKIIQYFEAMDRNRYVQSGGLNGGVPPNAGTNDDRSSMFSNSTGGTCCPSFDPVHDGASSRMILGGNGTKNKRMNGVGMGGVSMHSANLEIINGGESKLFDDKSANKPGEIKVRVRVVYDVKIPEAVVVTGTSVPYFELGKFPSKDRLNGLYEVQEANQLFGNYTLWQKISQDTAMHRRNSKSNNKNYDGYYSNQGDILPRREQHVMYTQSESGKTMINFASRFETLAHGNQKPLATCLQGNWYDKDTNRWVEHFHEKQKHSNRGDETQISVKPGLPWRDRVEIEIYINTAAFYRGSSSNHSNTHPDMNIVRYFSFWQTLIDQYVIEAARIRWYYTHEEKKHLSELGQAKLSQKTEMKIGVKWQDSSLSAGVPGTTGGLLAVGEEEEVEPAAPVVAEHWEDEWEDDELLNDRISSANSKDGKDSGRDGIADAASGKGVDGKGGKKGKGKDSKGNEEDEGKDEGKGRKGLSNDRLPPTEEQLANKQTISITKNGNKSGTLTDRQRLAYESYDLRQVLTDGKYSYKNAVEREEFERDPNSKIDPDNLLYAPLFNEPTKLLFRGIFGFDPERIDSSVIGVRHKKKDGQGRDGLSHSTNSSTGGVGGSKMAAGSGGSSSAGGTQEIELDLVPNAGKPYFQNDLLDVIRLGRGEPIMKGRQKEDFRRNIVKNLKEAQRMITAWLQQLESDTAVAPISEKMGMSVPDGEQGHWHAERGLRDDHALYPEGVAPYPEEISYKTTGDGNEYGSGAVDQDHDCRDVIRVDEDHDVEWEEYDASKWESATPINHSTNMTQLSKDSKWKVRIGDDTTVPDVARQPSSTAGSKPAGILKKSGSAASSAGRFPSVPSFSWSALDSSTTRNMMSASSSTSRHAQASTGLGVGEPPQAVPEEKKEKKPSLTMEALGAWGE